MSTSTLPTYPNLRLERRDAVTILYVNRPQVLNAINRETLAEIGDATRAFIADPSKNSFDRRSGKILLSRIFDWNRVEFERSGGTLLRFIARYAPDRETAAWLGSAAYKPRFIEYDWRLNQR